MAPDTKPATPSPVPHRKTEFLFQADDQAAYEQWKNRLEKVARPSEEIVVSSFLKLCSVSRLDSTEIENLLFLFHQPGDKIAASTKRENQW